MRTFVTSESVTEGHPDKVCDRISDAVLDAYLSQDPEARVACETMATGDSILVTGEITARPDVHVNVDAVVRQAVRDIGYTDPAAGFSADTLTVFLALRRQSSDIAQGVDTGGAGDQGIMFGYASNETKTFMPFSMDLAHRLARRLAKVRKDETLAYLRPDGKSQVTIEYDNGKPIRAKAVVIATQHADGITTEQVRRDVKRHVIEPILGSLLDAKTEIYINQTGRFVIGGPVGDAGLTGRKIIVDTYGGVAHHGGGAFSGKDPTKVDRSAAYACRWIAKNLVAAGVADRLEVGIAYVIGHANPLSLSVETFGTEKVPREQIVEFIRTHFDLTPRGIIKRLNLKRPIYSPVTAYGHFGRDDLALPWEALDEVEAIKRALLVAPKAR
jgi:S-adenosylmethionine synthetase